MQFSAEIAPRGKEGPDIALAVLPYFLGKIGATVMADLPDQPVLQRRHGQLPRSARCRGSGSASAVAPLTHRHDHLAEDLQPVREDGPRSHPKAQVAAEEAEAAAQEPPTPRARWGSAHPGPRPWLILVVGGLLVGAVAAEVGVGWPDPMTPSTCSTTRRTMPLMGCTPRTMRSLPSPRPMFSRCAEVARLCSGPSHQQPRSPRS